MFHNSRAMKQDLVDFITAHVTGHRVAFDLSNVKGDGSVTVRFRSSTEESSDELSYRFHAALNARMMDFVQTDDNKFRVPLAQFAV
jgi:hypothetical protein